MSADPGSIRYFSLTILVSILLLAGSSFLPAGDLDKDVLKYTNKFRKSNGLPELAMRDDLNKIARKHSVDMASGRLGFGHGGFAERQKEVNRIFRFHQMAENVAYGPR